MKGLGLSSFDIERGKRLYKKKVEVEKPVVSGVQESIDQTGSNLVQTSDARPTVQTDIAAGLGSRAYRSEEDIIEKQREDAKEKARLAAKRRRKKRKTNRDANVAASRAVKEQQAAGRTESIQQKITRGGGFKKGGLASRK